MEFKNEEDADYAIKIMNMIRPRLLSERMSHFLRGKHLLPHVMHSTKTFSRKKLGKKLHALKKYEET